MSFKDEFTLISWQKYNKFKLLLKFKSEMFAYICFDSFFVHSRIQGNSLFNYTPKGKIVNAFGSRSCSLFICPCGTGEERNTCIHSIIFRHGHVKVQMKLYELNFKGSAIQTDMNLHLLDISLINILFLSQIWNW